MSSYAFSNFLSVFIRVVTLVLYVFKCLLSSLLNVPLLWWLSNLYKNLICKIFFWNLDIKLYSSKHSLLLNPMRVFLTKIISFHIHHILNNPNYSVNTTFHFQQTLLTNLFGILTSAETIWSLGCVGSSKKPSFLPRNLKLSWSPLTVIHSIIESSLYHFVRLIC